MDRVLIISLCYLVGISLLLVLNELNYRIWKFKGEYSRKVAHVLATLATIPFPYLFDSHWYVLGLAILFMFVLLISQRIKQLNSIHGITRLSYGSFLLPISIYLTFLIYTFSGDPVFYTIPISILAISDPVAAMVGMRFQKNNVSLAWPGRRSSKTLFGSLSFYVSSTLLCAVLLIRSGLDINYVMLVSPVIGFVGTLAELFSWRGSDNLSIPLCVQLGLLWLL